MKNEWITLALECDYYIGKDFYTLPGRCSLRAEGNTLDLKGRTHATVRFPDGLVQNLPFITRRWCTPNKDLRGFVVSQHHGVNVEIHITDVEVLASEWTLPE